MGKHQRRSKATAPQQPAAEAGKRLCTNFAKGSCRFGAQCWFAHSTPDEQQQQQQDASAGSSPTKIEETMTVAELVSEVTAEAKRLRQELHASEKANAELKQEAVANVEELRRATERADSIQAERDKLKQQLEKLRLELKASEKEAAAKGEELRRASERAQAERDELKQQLKDASAKSAGASSSQLTLPGQAGFCGAEWCFESGMGEWTSLPASSSADLLRSYQDFSKGGDAIVHMKSGVDEYTFDFKAMSQTNRRTGKSRAIKCRLHTPSNWARCTSLENVCEANEAESYELSGFDHPYLNGTYTLSSFHKIKGHKTWWNGPGSSVMYVDPATSQLNVLWANNTYSADRADIAQGGWRGHARCEGTTEPHLARTGWDEFRDGAWQQCKSARVAQPGQNSSSPLMDIAVEFLDKPTLEEFEKLLRNSAVHQKKHHGASGCTSFRDHVKVQRVLRIENWHLWTKYQNHLDGVRRDLSKLGLTLAAIEPALPAALSKLPAQCGSLDDKVGEYMLFHGTDYETAAKISFEGFDFRLSKPGFYGHGTYFASQACKSHQYTKAFQGLHTIIVSRVVVGDVSYATKVDKECKRPPLRAGTPRCCDTVVAKPGPMPGHHAKEQTHQEFVIFDKFQAYPEFIVQYACDA